MDYFSSPSSSLGYSRASLRRKIEKQFSTQAAKFASPNALTQYASSIGRRSSTKNQLENETLFICATTLANGYLNHRYAGMLFIHGEIGIHRADPGEANLWDMCLKDSLYIAQKCEDLCLMIPKTVTEYGF